MDKIPSFPFKGLAMLAKKSAEYLNNISAKFYLIFSELSETSVIEISRKFAIYYR